MITDSDSAYLRGAMDDVFLHLPPPADIGEYATFNVFSGDTCLHYAAHRGDLRAVTILLALGANPNCIGDMGSTPLHNAYQSKSAEVISLLIANGADQNIKDEFGRLPSEV